MTDPTTRVAFPATAIFGVWAALALAERQEPEACFTTFGFHREGVQVDGSDAVYAQAAAVADEQGR